MTTPPKVSTHRVAVSIIAVLVCLPASAPARQPETRQFQQQVKPGFRVSPIVHEFEARRGAVIPFQFELETVQRETTIRIRAVALTQDENGTIIPDTDSPPPNQLQLLTPEEMELKDDETKLIRGRTRVPFTDSKFLSYGVLVTDLGRIVGTHAVPTSDQGERRVGVRFVTRYLLRCDIRVTGVRGGNVARVVLESAELAEVDGRAKANVWISNPTDSPFEFEMRARLARPSEGTRQKSFPLHMPNRETSAAPQRRIIRLLPAARIRVQEYLPDAVFPGDYEMQVDLVTNRRSRKQETFPVAINAGDFPAQDALIVQVARDITVQPSQLELSLRRGGDRYVPLQLANNSQQTVHINLTLKPQSGARLDWLTIRPSTVSLRPGTERKVLVMMAPGINVAEHQYGLIQVDAAPEEGAAIGSFDVPVALLARSDEAPQLQIQSPTWDNHSDQPGFTAPVINSGAMHAPLDAKLTLTNAFGRSFELQAGFGRWLLPGQQTELRFRTKFAPPAGDYRYKLEVQPTDGETKAVEGVLRVEEQSSAENGR